MKKRLFCSAFVLFLAMGLCGTGTAEAAIPDLVGTWEGRITGISFPQGDNEEFFSRRIRITVDADQQVGVRFAGELELRNDNGTLLERLNITGIVHDEDDILITTRSIFLQAKLCSFGARRLQISGVGRFEGEVRPSATVSFNLRKIIED